MKKVAAVFAVLLILAIVRILTISPSSNGDHAPVAAESSSCAVTDFSLSKVTARTEYEYAKLTGIVTNHCKNAVGVQLKWTAFNSDGTVAFSNDFWPASTTNIPPGTDYPFEMMNESPRGKWTYRVEPIALNTW